MQRYNSTRCAKRAIGGFTVFELLVVMAIVGLLSSLLLPAVQRSREAARKADCISRLHEIGGALAAHESTHGRFPGTFQMAHNGAPEYRFSPQAQLLPFLDQSPLYNQLDIHEQASLGGGPFLVRENEEFMRTVISAFICPSDTVPEGALNYRACHGTGPGEYGYTPQNFRESPVYAGAFGRQSQVAAKFLDGLSSTAMFSERLVGDMNDEHYSPRRDVFFAGGQTFLTPEDAIDRCRLPAGADPEHESGVGGTWLIGYRNLTGYNHLLTPNSPTPDCVAGLKSGFSNSFNSGAMQAYGATTARSNHDGCVNVLFGDGSVKTVSNSVDLAVWRAWSSIDGHD
jgi:prepilin-type N-terminal cleavage/methylation domain-containing protein